MKTWTRGEQEQPKRRAYNRVGAVGATESEYIRDWRLRKLTDERLAHLIEWNRRRLDDLEHEKSRRDNDEHAGTM